MRSISSLSPLLLAAGILLAGNGLQGTLITLRAAQEGFSSGLIGLMGTAYFAGFMISSLVAAKMIQAVGHIRVFSALAASLAATTLLYVLWVDSYVWIALRFFAGFGFAGLFMVIESWLNDASDNANRAKVLSIYRIVDLSFVTGGQLLLPIFGIEGFVLFAIISILLSFSLVPISLADRTNPRAPKSVKFSLSAVWTISPIACLGCIIIGMTNSSFRLVGPLFASKLGMDTANVALFMSMGIIGGAVLQYPLGWLSDKYDRRWVLIATTFGAAAAGSYLAYFAGTNVNDLLMGAFVFGAFSLPLYSLSAAHANDRAKDGEYVLLAAGLMFFFSLGATIGPSIAAWVMTEFGSNAFFTYISLVHGTFAVATVWRLFATPSVAKKDRRKFIGLMRTSPILFKMARAVKPKSAKNKNKPARDS